MSSWLHTSIPGRAPRENRQTNVGCPERLITAIWGEEDNVVWGSFGSYRSLSSSHITSPTILTLATRFTAYYARPIDLLSISVSLLFWLYRSSNCASSRKLIASSGFLPFLLQSRKVATFTKSSLLPVVSNTFHSLSPQQT